MATYYLAYWADYSDHGIIGLYSDEGTAQKAAEIYGYSASVMRLELDKGKSQLEQGLTLFWVQFDDIALADVHCHKGDNIGISEYVEVLPRDGDRQFMRLVIWARDEQHAAKIANERRERWLAEH